MAAARVARIATNRATVSSGASVERRRNGLSRASHRISSL